MESLPAFITLNEGGFLCVCSATRRKAPKEVKSCPKDFMIPDSFDEEDGRICKRFMDL